MRGLTFTRRPMYVPVDLRIDWMVAALICCLAFGSRANKSSQPRLQALAWAILRPGNMEQMLHTLKQEGNPEETAVRYDTSITRAIDLAIGFGFIERTPNAKLQLTDNGKEVAANMEAVQAFELERAFLIEIKPQMSDDQFAHNILEA